uniref:Uncharacterized protein n=1 Tax=Romanomermis culicivorax TaxID=13658 RepID=A0A915I9G1_ROMCU
MQISFEETTKSASTPYNTGRFCADPFKRQIHELMKQYKKDAKRDINEELKSSRIKKDDRSYEEKEDDDDDEEDDDGDSAGEKTIYERATEESTSSTISTTFLRSSEFYQLHVSLSLYQSWCLNSMRANLSHGKERVQSDIAYDRLTSC